MALTEPATNPQAPPPTAHGVADELAGATLSKKQTKKLAKKEAKEDRKQQSSASAAAGRDDLSEADPFATNYGDVPVEEIQSMAISCREWTEIGALEAQLSGQSVLIRGVAQTIRPVSKKMAFLVLRQYMSTVQCVLSVDKESVSPQMVKFATALSEESIVDIQGIVSVPKDPIKGTT